MYGLYVYRTYSKASQINFVSSFFLILFIVAGFGPVYCSIIRFIFLLLASRYFSFPQKRIGEKQDANKKNFENLYANWILCDIKFFKGQKPPQNDTHEQRKRFWIESNPLHVENERKCYTFETVKSKNDLLYYRLKLESILDFSKWIAKRMNGDACYSVWNRISVLIQSWFVDYVEWESSEYCMFWFVKSCVFCHMNATGIIME